MPNTRSGAILGGSRFPLSFTGDDLDIKSKNGLVKLKGVNTDGFTTVLTSVSASKDTFQAEEKGDVPFFLRKEQPDSQAAV